MIEFKELQLTAPDGCIVGVIEEGSTLAWANDPLPKSPVNAVLQYPLVRADALTRARTISRLVELRRAGATLVMISHDEPLLAGCADEIWWLRDGQLIARGDPTEVLQQYRIYVAQALREAGRNEQAPLVPVLRDGDGRAVLTAIDLIGADSAPTTVWHSGEAATIRVTVRFTAEVADPVVGILIRTRIGLNVYGTNTELENIHFGPVREGDTIRVTYRFRCDLCPGDYTVTAASHDPDGVWHDWLEDAVAFAVADERYTAGVANLRAKSVVEVLPRTKV